MLRYSILVFFTLIAGVCLGAIIPESNLDDALKLSNEQAEQVLTRQQRGLDFGFGDFGGHGGYGHHGGYGGYGHHAGYDGYGHHAGYPGYGHQQQQHHHHHHHSPYGHYPHYPHHHNHHGYDGDYPGFGIYFG